jgi:hypothetical protein
MASAAVEKRQYLVRLLFMGLARNSSAGALIERHAFSQSRYSYLNSFNVIARSVAGSRTPRCASSMIFRERDVAARSVTQTCATGNQRLHRGVRFRCCRSAHRQPLSARQRLWACANPRQHSGWPLPPLRSADTFAAALRRLCQKQFSRGAVVERRHASTPHAVSHGPAAIIAP